MSLLSFNNDLKVKTKYVNRVLAHIIGALKNGSLRADIKTGNVFTRRGPMKCKSARGYIVGTVHLNGRRKQVKAHQVVWLAAGKIIPNGHILDHINRIKIDNRIENLRVVSHKENSKNRRSYGGTENPAAKINQKIAKDIRSQHATGWSYTALATHFKISKSLVAKVIRRELWV
jgi:hypothetical protein